MATSDYTKEKKPMKKDVNEDLLMKLPMWVRERVIYLHKEKDGHTSYYNAVLIPFEYDICQDEVKFCVSGIREFQRQLNKYYRGCQRPVNRE
mgnify:CR=1 FL=1